MIHLHWWSHYSMLSAIGTPKDIIQKAKENNQTAIAITDFNSWYGLLEFYEKAKDIKAILWTDIYFSYDWENFMNIVLLAKNYTWYKNIIKLISIAQTKNIKQVPYIKMEDIEKYSEGIIALSWWNWEIEKLIISKESDDVILSKIQEYENIFNQEFYLEFLTYDYKIVPERKKIEDAFLRYMAQNNKKWVVSSNYRYLNKSDKDTYDILLCIKNNWKYYDPKREKVKKDSYIMTEEEVKYILSKNLIKEDIQEYLVKNTHKISDMIDCKIPLGNLLFPKYIVPTKYENLYKKLNKNAS